MKKKQVKLSRRKFYSTRFVVTVLSEEPLAQVDLEDVAHMISEGVCSGQVTQGLPRELNGRQAAQALLRQGSDPGFFRLTPAGEEDDEQEQDD